MGIIYHIITYIFHGCNPHYTEDPSVMTTPMILTAQIPNHRQDHWGHHLISSLRAQAIRNNLTRDRDTIAVVSGIGIWFPDFWSKTIYQYCQSLWQIFAICTACKFQECFRMIHVEIYTGNCLLEGKNHDSYFSRATFIPAGSNSNDPRFFPEHWWDYPLHRMG